MSPQDNVHYTTDVVSLKDGLGSPERIEYAEVARACADDHRRREFNAAWFLPNLALVIWPLFFMRLVMSGSETTDA